MFPNAPCIRWVSGTLWTRHENEKDCFHINEPEVFNSRSIFGLLTRTNFRTFPAPPFQVLIGRNEMKIYENSMTNSMPEQTYQDQIFSARNLSDRNHTRCNPLS